MSVDPLEAVESLPVDAQIAVIVSVLRTTRNTMARVEKKVDWVLRALWTLITTIIVGVIVFLVNAHHTSTSHARPQPPAIAAIVVRKQQP